MNKLTITEALVELKLIDSKVHKKKEFIGQFLCRQDGLRDPLEKQGGSVTLIKQELQSIGDLQERKVAIRRAIQSANAETALTVEGVSRTIADWLAWRRDVVPIRKQLLADISAAIQRNRAQAQKQGFGVVPGTQAGQAQPSDLLVNIDEMQLSRDIEELETILGRLDGQLSLANATTTIELD